jgi:hypothetical protein
MNIKFSKNLKTTTVAVLMILLMVSSVYALTAPVKAQVSATQQTTGPLPTGVTPNVTINPRAFLSFTPTTVGINQQVLVNVWTTAPPNADRLHHDYQITITAPDGSNTTKTIDSEVADGTAWFTLTPTQIGTYQLQFNFLGTYFPAGRYSVGYMVTNTTGTLYTESMYYTPASTSVQNLTVQQDMVSSFPAMPLPTDYWTRPVTANNREWWSILGNFPWVNGNTHDFAGPYVIAPTSAHVVWRRQGAIAGLVGGESGQLSIDASQVIGAGAAGNPSVIYDGRCYETYAKQGVGNVAACYDLQTGQIYYEIPIAQGGVTPTYVSDTASASEGGSTNMGVGAELIAFSGAQMIKIDPWTGLVLTNVTCMSGTFFDNNYVLSVQTINASAGNYRLINWTTVGTSSTFASRIVSNITFPWSNIGTVYDLNTSVGVQITTPTSTGGALTQQIATAASLTTGQILWNMTIDGGSFSSSCCVADNGKVAILVDKGYYLCYDLLTGKELWQSPTMDYPWDAPAFGAYDVASAYGMIYRSAYTGVYAFNWTNGNIVWKFESTTPYQFETPYTDANGTSVYSWNGGILVANGMVFDYNTEHSPTEPITRGWGLYAINVTTGTNVWNVTAYSGSRTFRGAVSDGYLAFDNFYDGYMYVYGKGLSSTTVTAPQTQITAGQNAVISGTVLDKSPGAPNTPCVSDNSMGVWMDYIYMQQPKPANVTGVPISIDAMAPNGNMIHIATVTSDGMSGTFGYTWAPTTVGQYTIYATFVGDDSYGSSFATTYATVTNAVVTTTAPTTSTLSIGATSTDTLLMALIGGIIAIIIAIGIVGVLLLKKK